MRTLAVRLKLQGETGIKLAKWLQRRPEVSRVLHPALPKDPGHKIWKRDFIGASGLFGVILNPIPEGAVSKFLNALNLFGLGYSWGGYESLAIPTYPTKIRAISNWDTNYPFLRLHAGLEHPKDLIADLQQALDKL